MNIPKLIQALLNIHDLTVKVNQLDMELKALQTYTTNEITKLNEQLEDQHLLHQNEIKELNDSIEEDIQKTVEMTIENLDLTEAVSTCIEDLNITLKIN